MLNDLSKHIKKLEMDPIITWPCNMTRKSAHAYLKGNGVFVNNFSGVLKEIVILSISNKIKVISCGIISN